jgi:TPR repeat protein
MVAVLLRRGDDLLGEGDISAARLFYERAASAGSARGASGAGRTYDPAFLARIDVRGLRGDTVRAIDWYRKAIELGDKGAAEPLKALIDLTGR